MIAVLLVSWSVALPDGGGVSFKGGASFETTSEALSELNGKYYMFTYESDAEWNLYPCE